MTAPKYPQKTMKNRRISPRKTTESIRVGYLTSLEDFAKIARKGAIVEASSTGLLMEVKREDIIPASLRKNLDLNILIGENVFVRIEDMNLEISGTIARTQLSGKKGFLIALDYSEDAPEYWRECLADLLPRPGEIDPD